MSFASKVTTPAQTKLPLANMVFINGAEQRVVTLERVPFTIGRQAKQDLVITDARVAREHATIRMEDGEFVLVDAGARQGTYVNGQKISRHKLNYNDVVEFGSNAGPYLLFNPTSLEKVEELKALTSISRVSIFSKLSVADIQELGKLVTVKQYGSDAAVFFQDEPSDSLYMVLKGTVKVSERSTEGHDKILGILGAGEIFGEMAMLDGNPRSATVTTCEPTELATIAQRDFRQFAATRPEMVWKVMAALCERIRKTNADILELSSREVPCRLLAALDQLAEKYGKVAADGSCRISLKLSFDDLAAIIGTHREIVSRLLHRYQEQGLIELGKDKQVIISDPAAFTRAVEYAADWC